MISTAPFRWLMNTIGGWHIAIWIALGVLIVSSRNASEAEVSMPVALLFALTAVALAYAILALTFGQIFGDKYRFEQIWFTSLVLGTAVSATFVLWISILDAHAESGFLVTAFLMFAIFLGGAFNLFLYVMPRVVGWGVYKFPRQAWGVVN